VVDYRLTLDHDGALADVGEVELAGSPRDRLVRRLRIGGTGRQLQMDRRGVRPDVATVAQGTQYIGERVVYPRFDVQGEYRSITRGRQIVQIQLRQADILRSD